MFHVKPTFNFESRNKQKNKKDELLIFPDFVSCQYLNQFEDKS